MWTNKIPTIVGAVLVFVVILTVLRLPFILRGDNSYSDSNAPWRQYLENEGIEDQDYTSFPTRNCTLCRLQGLQCCFSDGRESCLGPEFHCAQRSKQSCHTRHCPKLGQNRSHSSPPHNRLCSVSSQHYYYCKGMNCAQGGKCIDGSDALRAFLRPDQVVGSNALRETLTLTGVLICAGLLIYIYHFHNLQPIKARNIWLMVGEIVCSLLWFTVELNNHLCPCAVYVGAIIFCSLYLSMSKICRIAHVMLANKVEVQKKRIQTSIYDELVQLVKKQTKPHEVVIEYHDEDSFSSRIEDSLVKIHDTKRFLSYPMMIIPLVLALIMTLIYQIFSAMILGADLIFTTESCTAHSSVGITVMSSLTISIACYCLLVYYARRMITNTIIGFTREFAIDAAIFVCLTLLVSFCYIFGTIASTSQTRGMISSTMSSSTILSVNMISPFTSLINIGLMLGNSIIIPVGESAYKNRNEEIVECETLQDNSSRLRRTCDSDTRQKLNRLGQVLRGTLSLDLLKNYAATEYCSEYVILWRLIDTYRNHQEALRVYQQKKLLKYLHHIFIGSNFALPLQIPTLQKTKYVKLDDRTLYEMQMEVTERHLLPMYNRMARIRRYEEQLQVLSESGAMPPLESYDIYTPRDEYKESYDNEEDISPFATALPGHHVILPHASSQEERR